MKIYLSKAILFLLVVALPVMGQAEEPGYHSADPKTNALEGIPPVILA
jgi:hypothetical protein